MPVPREFTIKMEYTVAANAAAGTTVQVKFTTDPAVGAENQVLVPKGYRLVIKDIYVTGTPNVDAQISLYRNGEELVLTTDPVSTLGVSNPARPKYKPIVIDEQNFLVGKATTLAAGGASATTDYVYMKAELVPKAGAPSPGAGGLAKIRAKILGR